MANGTLLGQVSLANSSRGYTEKDLTRVRNLADVYAVAIQRRKADEELTQEIVK
jgi:hypothetical protein